MGERLTKQVEKETATDKPRVLEITFDGKKPEGNLDFGWWLRNYVYTQTPDTTSAMYGRHTNPLIINLDEVAILKEEMVLYRFPYIFMGGECGDEKFNNTSSILERAVGEYFHSFGYKIDLVQVVKPEEDEKFQKFLYKSVGGHEWVKPKDKSEELLANYFSQFCSSNPNLIKGLVLSLTWTERERERQSSGPDDD